MSVFHEDICDRAGYPRLEITLDTSRGDYRVDLNGCMFIDENNYCEFKSALEEIIKKYEI